MESRERAGRVIQGLDLGSRVVVAPAYSEAQETAVALYLSGFNVLPLPRPHEVRAWAAAKPEERKPDDKPAYLLNPLFTSRMHLCGPECSRRTEKTGRRCIPEHADFISLFDRANVGVVVGRTSGNLIDLDCDSKRAADHVYNRLTRLNLPFIGISTHRGARYLLRIAEGEVKNLPKGKAAIDGLEVWGHDHYAVVPPSIHPLGTIYDWITPAPSQMVSGEYLRAISIQDLAWLGLDLRRENGSTWADPDLHGLPAWTISLSRKNRAILANASRLEKGTRNASLVSPVYDLAACINAGLITRAQALEVLEPAAEAAGQDGRAMLKSALRKKGLTRAARNTQRRPTVWELAREFADSYDWRKFYGRKAQGARAAFIACTVLAERAGECVFRATVREVADLANFATHQRAIRLLQDLRISDNEKGRPALLILQGQDKRSEGNLYSFAPFVLGGVQNSTTIPTLVVNSGAISHTPKIPTTQAEKDVFRAVGALSWSVWVFLKHNPTGNVSALARAIGQDRTAVSRALSKNRNSLLSAGLVIRREGLYYGEPKSNDQLETIAAILGSFGRADKTRRSFQKDREKRVNFLLAKARAYWHARWRRYEDRRSPEASDEHLT